MIRNIRTKKMPAMLLVLATALNLTTVGGLTANAAPPGDVNVLKSEKISSGVHFTSEEYNSYYKPNNRVVVNRLDINPADSNTKIITAKAYDTISAVETVGDQANREILKGNQVIAGVDGDFYDIDPASGNPLGLIMKDGELIISQAPDETAANYRTSFFMDNTNKPGITQVHAEGKFSVAGAVYGVNLLNRNQAVNNALVIHTSEITKTRKMTHNYAADKGKSVFALIRVNHFDGGVDPGQTYTGTVVSVTDTEGFDIPDDSVVLEGVGTSKPIVQALQTNAEVSFTYDLYAGKDAANKDIMNNNIVTSITSNAWLVRDGVAVTTGDPAANARTALGMKADGSLVVVTVDKPGSSYTGSIGTGLPDLGKYLLEAGAVNALNLDGGGSTEMIVRQAGSDRPVTVSHPSDVNGSRLVSSSLLFVSTATKGATVGNVVVDKNTTLLQGSKSDFSIRITDEFGNPIDKGDRPVSWETTIGAIDENGHFIANTGAGSGEVTATVDGVKGSAKVTVVDSVATVALTSTNVVMNNNASKQFGFVATDATGSEVFIDPSVATWSLSGNIGTVSESGLVASNDSNGTATLTVTVAGKTLTTLVTVGIKEQVIDNFETYPIEGYHLSGIGFNSVSQYAGSAGTSPYLSISTAVKHSGSKSFKFDYDLSKWTNKNSNGTLNWIPHWYTGTKWSDTLANQMLSTYKTDVYPKKFGIWVNGDGKSPWLRAIFRDSSGGADKTLDLTTETDDINWVGWKYLEVPIPEGWKLPITLNYLYMVETTKSKPAYSGTVYFDDMKYIYTDDVTDTSGPEFTETSPSSDGLFSNTLDFSTTISDSLSGVDESKITVKVNGTVQPYNFDKNTGRLSFKLDNLTEGDYKVFVEAYDKAGNQSVPYIDKTYHLDLTPDITPPTMTDVTPNKDVKVKIPTPRVTFKLLDGKSQVDADSISVKMNGMELPVYYDAATGWGYAEPTSDLANGTYALSIDAKDKAGNAMATYSDNLTLESIPQPKDGDNFKISLIPDTQGNAFTDKLFAQVAKDDTSLVMHMGDIVDDGSQKQYDDASNFVNKYFGAPGSKPFFVLAGNHEAFQNTLDIYYKKFGSPTMHFDYGDTLIIMLNSAYIQSLTLSDSTQFHWLEEVLKKNKKKNVIVLDHVITRDAFGTKHEMDPKDAAKYESILSDYKLQHPDTDIYSIFGHLHSLQSWEVGGVKYIITGNGADKTYLPHSDGDLLGTGKMTVTGGKMKYTFDPLVTKVYIHNDAVISGKMNAVIGSQVQLDLFGDFREYPANYMAQINNRKLVGIDWKSSNNDVASVDENGVITSKAAGTATITATSGGKSSSITVETVKPADVTPVKLELLVDSSVEVGVPIVPTIKATNAYGAVYALGMKDVAFSFKNGIVSQADNGSLVANSEGEEEITVTFNGLKASAKLTVYPSPTVNLALNKPTMTSDNPNKPGSFAVDGKADTRWESAFSDPQFITVDLKSEYSISHVRLNWENAAGKNYDVQVSTDGIAWNTVYATTQGHEGIDDIKFPDVNARYVKVNGTVRTTKYGYSLYEFEVFGSPSDHMDPPELIADTTANQAGQPIDIAFEDDAAWRNAISAVKVNGTALSSSQYVVTNGKIALNASLFPEVGNYLVTIEAKGYMDAVVMQLMVTNSTVNLAFKKPTTTSANPLQDGNKAVDGVKDTRWESAFSDPQFITVDLGAENTISRVLLNWENAAGKSYTVQVSTDGTTWNTVYATTTGKPGINDITFAPVSARYVKMNGTARTTSYGYSLYEFEVYGNPSGVPEVPNPVNLAIGKSTSSSPNYHRSADDAVDGRFDRRWESDHADNQWMSVDLGAPTTINRVALYWENAYGKAYTIDVSEDGQTWTTVYSTDSGDGDSDEIAFAPVTARFVKMNGLKRGTPYGFSLWEFEVYGSPAAPSI
ncbi:discoidin domain-containing protein [Cohnella lupini]|nr:discoidin domain-containing protein [Cohnella lupini]